REIALGSLGHQPGELLLEGVVHLLEGVARDGKSLGELAAHADGLGALSREYECPHHPAFPAPFEARRQSAALRRKSALGAAESSACASIGVVYSARPPCRAGPG